MSDDNLFNDLIPQPTGPGDQPTPAANPADRAVPLDMYPQPDPAYAQNLAAAGKEVPRDSSRPVTTAQEADPFADLVPSGNTPAQPAAPDAFSDLTPQQKPQQPLIANAPPQPGGQPKPKIPTGYGYSPADFAATEDVAKGISGGMRDIKGTVLNLLGEGSRYYSELSGDKRAMAATEKTGRQLEALGNKQFDIAAQNAPQTIVGQIAGIGPYIPFLEAGPLVMGLETYYSKAHELQGGEYPVDEKTAKQVGMTQGALMSALAFMPGGKQLEPGAINFIKSLVSGGAKMAALGTLQYDLGQEASEHILTQGGNFQRAAQEAPTLTGAEHAALSMAIQHIGVSGTHALIDKYTKIPVQPVAGEEALPETTGPVKTGFDRESHNFIVKDENGNVLKHFKDPDEADAFAKRINEAQPKPGTASDIPEDLVQKPYDIEEELAKQGLAIGERPPRPAQEPPEEPPPPPATAGAMIAKPTAQPAPVAAISKPIEPVHADVGPFADLVPEVPTPQTETLHTLSADEIDARLADAKAEDKQKLVRALGEEGAKRFTQLERTANSTNNPQRADEAAKQMSEMEDAMTPEQQKLVYGIGETGTSIDDLETIRDAHRDKVSADDPISYIVKDITYATGKVDADKIFSVPKNGGTAREQAAYIRVKAAIEALAQKGVKPADMTRLLTEAYEARGLDKNDAAYMVENIVKGYRSVRPESPKPEPATPAIAPPKSGPKPKVEPAAKPLPPPLAAEEPHLTDMVQRLKDERKPQQEAKYPILSYLKKGGVDPNSEFGKRLQDVGITNTFPLPGLFTEPRFIASTNRWVGKSSLEGKSPNDLPEDIRNLLPIGDPNEGMDLDAAVQAIATEVHKAGAGRNAEDPHLYDLSAEAQQRGIDIKGQSANDIARAIIKGRQKEARDTAKSLGATLNKKEAAEVASIYHAGYDMQDALDQVLERRVTEQHNAAIQKHEVSHDEIPWPDFTPVDEAGPRTETKADRQQPSPAEEAPGEQPGAEGTGPDLAQLAGAASLQKEKAELAEQSLLAAPEESAADIARRKAEQRLKGKAGQKSVDDLGLFGEGRAKGQTDIFAEQKKGKGPIVHDVTVEDNVAPPADAKSMATSEAAEDVLDLHRKPTGWKMVKAFGNRGVTLINPHTGETKAFGPVDNRSGQAGVRANAMAQAHAIDNPIKGPAIGSGPAPELISRPIFEKPESEAPPLELKAPTGEEGIQDFGEKIHGAKKELWQEYQKAMKEELPTEAKDITMSKHFPQPNYEALIERGIPVKALAAIKAMRDEIPNKPQLSRKQERWAATVRQLRALSNDILEGKYQVDDLLKRMRSGEFKALPELAGKIEMYDELGYPAFTKAGDWAVRGASISMHKGIKYDPPRGMYFASRRGSYGEGFDTRQEAVDWLRKRLEAEAGTTSARKTNLDIYRVTKSGDIVIGKKVGPGKFIDLKPGFAKVGEARTYLKENEADLLKLLEQKKEQKPERRSTNDPRKGEDYRLGENVTSDQFTKEFGFRGVQFGNYVEQGRRPRDLNNAYDSLKDMANLLDIPTNALSLDGKLGLAFGARGSGGQNAAAAHYEPDHVVINLTKHGGAGTLGHEWWHAFDNYMGKKAGASYFTGVKDFKPLYGRSGDKLITPEIIDAFKGINDAIKSTGMVSRSMQRDKTRSKDYWSTNIELSARAYEKYLIDRAAEKGLSNDYLANIIGEDLHKKLYGDEEPFPYPTDKEMKVIGPAFDKLFTALKSLKEPTNIFRRFLSDTDGSVLFGRRIDGEKDAAGRLSLSEALSEAMPANAKDLMRDALHEGLMFGNPMGRGSKLAQAAAKDFANKMRWGQWNGSRMYKYLEKTYKPEQLKAMWTALDQASVHAQVLEQKYFKEALDKADVSKLSPKQYQDMFKAARVRAKAETEAAGIGHFALPTGQREILREMSNWSDELFQQAKDIGMVEGEGLPFWTPRMAAAIGDDGKWGRPNAPGSEGRPAINTPGVNLRKSSPNLKQRKYLTAAETEEAMKKLFEEEHGAGVALVRDIRTMPLAMTRLMQAISGRTLIDHIKQIGAESGTEAVSDQPGAGYFTLDHPAFKTYRPKLVKGEDGKWQPVEDPDGNPVMEQVPIYVSKQFEGPLRAVLASKSPAVYRGLMALKGKALGLIMYSPVIHNMVIAGRALDVMPGQVITLRGYFTGNKAKNDPVQMKEAIDAGLVPIGARYFNQDITSIMEQPNLEPGRSWTAQLLGGTVGRFNEKGGIAVKKAIDDFGDLWHNRLLWDRVGDLQMGMYVHMRDAMIKDGFPREVAAKMSAHVANRFSGALPLEAMSENARRLANLVMFSRSFTMGNLGVVKDMLGGLPSDVRAQIERDFGSEMATTAGNKVRRKALAAFVMSIGLMYAGNSVAQDALDMLMRDKSLSEVAQGYVDRYHRMTKEITANPSDLADPFFVPDHMVSTANNEPGKEDRIHFSDDPKTGTAYYLRLPTGKLGEEFKNWFHHPVRTGMSKESTLVRPFFDILKNADYFGKPIYKDDAKDISDMAGNVGRVAAYFLSGQVPLESIKSAYQLTTGTGDSTLNKMKAFGPLAGVTFSKGYPGGPVAGVLAAEKRRQEQDVTLNLPKIREAIEGGEQEKAVQMMKDMKMSPGQIRGLLRIYTVPQSRIKKGMKNFQRTASPEELEQLKIQRGE